MIRVKWLLLMALAFAFIVFGPHRPISAQTPLSQDVLNAYSQIREGTQIPTRLPTVIPLNAPAASQVNTVWASVYVERDEYTVSFDRAEDCTGVIECSFGSIRGTRLEGDETPISRAFQSVPDYDGQKGPVTLANGIQGYYVPAEPYLYDPASVVWEEGGVRYEAVLFMGDKQDVVAMANSAIQGG